MKSRYLACSMALAALFGVGTEAIAQTASVPARRLFLYDGGTAVTLNRITLESPGAATLTSNYGLILPPQQGNVNDIMFVESNSGSNNVLNFTNGSPLFWRVVGNDHVVVDGTNNLMGTLSDNRVRFITNGTATTNTPLLVMGNSADNYNFGMGVNILPVANTKLFISNTGEAGLTTGIGVNSNNIGIAINAADAGLSIGATTASTNGIEVRGSTGIGVAVGGFGGGTDPAIAVSATGSNRAFQALNSPVSFDGDGNTELGDGNTDVHTVWGALNVNTVAGQTAATTIGQTTDGGAVTINTSTTNPLTLNVGVTTNNLVLNNILSNAAIEDVVWLTAANQVRRTPFAGLVEQGITFNNEGGTSRIRLGGLASTDNPFLANRFVNLNTFNLNITANGGALTPLQVVGGAAPVINVTGTTNINTTVGALTNIGVAAGTNNITGTTTVLGATDVNVTGTALTRLGNATSTVTIQGGTNNVVGTANINSAAAATTNIGFAGGTNTVLGTTNINATGTGTTTIGNTAGGGAVAIRSANPNPITIDVAATTNNLVLNNILPAAITDDLLWITAANQVRRVSAASTADEGIQFNNGAYRLGHLVNGSNPIVNPRFVRTGPAGTLTFNTDATTSLVINGATGAVSINSAGAGTTAIGSATAGTISLQSVSTITATAGTTLDLNAADIDADATATIDLAAGSTFAATGATGATITATANNLTLNAAAGNLNGTGNTGVNLTATTGNAAITASAGNLTGTGNTGVTITATNNALTLNANGATGSVVVNATGAGNDVDINANDDVTIDATDILETATTTYALSAPTANINAATASTTNIGNTTNGIVNVRGNGNNGVTITGAQAAPGNNTIVMEIGNTASNLVINNIAVVNPIEDLLWINASNQVRRTPFSGTANEGIMFQTSAYRLGANAIDVNPIVSSRIVTVGAAGTLSFQTAAAANNMLQMNNNGNVAISSVGTGTTSIGSATAGNISLIAGNALSTVYVEANHTLTTVSGNNTISSAGGTYSITGATGASVTATTNNLTLAATAGQVNANAGTTFSATGATGATITATANALTLNANGASGSVVVNATGVGNDVDINANDAVTIDGATITNTATTSHTVVAPTANINVTGTGATNIGSTATGGAVNIRSANPNPITIDVAATTNNLVLNNIATDAVPTHMLTHNASSQVRRTELSGTADQGLIWDGVAGRYRLGAAASGTNPINTNRFVTINGAGNLTFDNGAGITMLTMANDGNVGISTAGAGLTNIGSATAGAITLQSVASITATAGTVLDLNGATVDVDATGALTLDGGTTATVTGATGASLVATTGAAAVTAVAGNATVTATGAGNDVVLTAPDRVQVDAASLVVNTSGLADLTITEDGLDRGANLITVGAAGGTLLLNGTAGTANITATSLSTDVLPAFVHPTDGIVIANGSGVLRRRPVTDLINANQGLTYNEDATANVQMGSTTDGNSAITTTRFVRVGAAGTLTFNGVGSNAMLVLNNNGNVAIAGGTGNTTIGNATGTFGLVSNQLNVASATGEISDAAGAVTINDIDGLVVTGTPTSAGIRVNTDGVPGGSDLIITETTVSRVGNININPGAGATVFTDGSAQVAVNLNVLGATQLGDGAGSDNITMTSGAGTITATGTTNINTTGSSSTSIGATTNSGAVNVNSQSTVNLVTGGTGTVNIQTSDNGDVVIGNSPAVNDLTINSNVRGAGVAAGSNRFAERITLAGAGAANFVVNNTRVTANGVILVSVENYTGAGILSYEITNRVAGASFEITFSAAVLGGENVTINYMIINP